MIDKKKKLQDKIAGAFDAVGKLPRHGRNAKYDFTRATDVFAAVRHELFKRGVLVVWDEQQPEYVAVGLSNGGEQITECRLHVKYGFEDSETTTPMRGVNGVGRDVEDKALYKAQTGAQKAMLKRCGLMAEEVDDPEFDGQREAEPAPAKPSKRVTERQVRLFEEACTASQRTADEIAGYLLTAHKVATVQELGRGKPFTEALEWAQRTESPKLSAVPAQQTQLPLRAAAQPVELRIGNKAVEFVPDPKQAAYSV